MTWIEMKKNEPRLGNLEAEARAAGLARELWSDTWQRLYEPLSKIVGPGSGGRFASSRAFEVAHRGLLMAWATADSEATVAPWEVDGETTPFGPGLLVGGG